MNIHIEDLEFDTIIGLLDFERKQEQRVIIELEISYSYENKNFINYADIVELIQNNLKEKCYKLLEEALLGVKILLHTTYPCISSLRLKISKPDILPQCSVALSNTWKFKI